MSLLSTLFALNAAALFVALILYVIFGQVTVRKLRINPATKDKLGIEFTSGWSILNVAQAIALPRFITDKLKQSPISSMYAHTDELLAHTTRFDRILARVFYWLFTGAGLAFVLMALLDTLGLFDYIESLT
ncbi:hypothetical protein PE36_01907 [Moritella sp. PE36]|uniref:hypothetical protein n=1 Tax=Moritella sp. PE36 TaxID=58051 RepID=UPI0001568466|nr:hypothetical protein [Moritella sp. PE36]EDM68696.1 hypothetical protein PE36_01907 [Moritella sp. PE36]